MAYDPATPCPHCGKVSGICRRVRAYGWAEDRIWEDGETELNIDEVVYTRTKTVRCVECHKVLKNAEWPE